MQTKSNRIRPPECKHVLFPRCGCQPPTPESVNPRVTSTVNPTKPRPSEQNKRPRGRPKTPWVHPDPAQDFLERLPHIMANPDLRDRLQKMVMAEECRRSLSKFCREAWPVVEPSTKLEWNWHHELLCSVLQGIFEEWEHAREDRKFRMRLNNLLINVPPGTGKSRLLACFFPVWVWIRQPGARFLCVSVNEDASLRDARDAKLLITCDWFQDTFQPDWHLKGDQDAISNFGTTRGGVRISKGQGGAVIGLRSDFLLVDDANDPTEVESKVKRDGVNVNWKDTLYNRVNHMERSVRIGIQQRTHEEDWSGFVLKQQGVWHAVTNPKGWLHVCLPAEFEPDRRCVTPWGQDPRTQKGESLHWGTPADMVAKMRRAVPNHNVPFELGGLPPEELTKEDGRLSPESLLSERLRLGANKYSGLMQQRPTAAEGGTIKLLWWRFFQYDETPLVPERRDRFSRDLEMDTAYPTLVVGKKGTYYPVWDFDWTCISIDCASKRTERGSQYGILVISGKGNKRFIRDDRTRRGDILEILKVVKDLCKEYGPQKILIEAKAAGNDLATLFQQEFQAGKIMGPNNKALVVRVEEVDPNNAGKEARLDPCLPEIAAGLVYVQERATWLDPFIGEVCGFPLATFDDRIDAMSQALNYFRNKGNYQLPSWK